MKRRTMATMLGAAVAGALAGSRLAAQDQTASPSPAPRHVCRGFNECRGQGVCKHGCSGHGCAGKNDCRGKNTCKRKGGCEVPLKIEHEARRKKLSGAGPHGAS